MKLYFSSLCKLLLFVIVCFISCQPKKNASEQVVREWQGKEIKLPDSIIYKVLGRDTLCSDVWDKSYKIISYFDSTGCIGCRLDLRQWKRFYDTCSVYQPSISLLLVVCSSDYSFLEQMLVDHEFSHPIIYDEQDLFDKLNHFPPQYQFRTFLLGKDNKVVLVGSPMNSPKMWELYKNAIMQSQ